MIDARKRPLGASRQGARAMSAVSCGLAAGVTTRVDFARPTELALDRSRLVVRAAATAAEIATGVAYAWPR